MIDMLVKVLKDTAKYLFTQYYSHNMRVILTRNLGYINLHRIIYTTEAIWKFNNKEKNMKIGEKFELYLLSTMCTICLYYTLPSIRCVKTCRFLAQAD